MNVSVILCTYNRCRVLATALESVAASQMPESVDWEVLVIDNNSKDDTREIVEGYRRRYPGRFRYFLESRQGKSHALNTGIRESKGAVLAFMDDDVTVEPTWLLNLTAALENRSWVGAGGRICPPENVFLPSWIGLEGEQSLAGSLALFDRGSSPRELADPPYGTNMAFHRDMFEKYGRFRTDLGPCPGSEIRGEDTEFCLRLMKAGEKLLYTPSAVVFHEVPENRLRKKYFLNWYFDYGRAYIRMKGPRPRVWVIPRPIISILNHLLIMLPKKILHWMLTFDEKQRFWAKTQVWMIAGETAEIHGQWVRPEVSREDVQPHALSQH
jgi:glycosyltransferase involved in cell wall biosynthesis